MRSEDGLKVSLLSWEESILGLEYLDLRSGRWRGRLVARFRDSSRSCAVRSSDTRVDGCLGKHLLVNNSLVECAWSSWSCRGDGDWGHDGEEGGEEEEER